MHPELDIKHPDNLKNPYPLFSYLRDEQPVYWSESLRAWVITRYDDVLHILQNPLVRCPANGCRRGLVAPSRKGNTWE